MKNLVLFIFLFLSSHISYAQQDTKQEHILYIVDNVPVIDDPEEGMGSLSNEEVDHLQVITSKAEIEKMGYTDVDKVILVFTKEYEKRPDSIKHIISTKLMVKKQGTWYAKNADTPYNGPFIDYYFNGKKQGEGVFKDGKVHGLRTLYYTNGYKSHFRNYVNGVENGYSEEYFPNGKLKQKGTFENGRDDGFWQDFYSTGKVKRQSTFVNDKIQFAKDEEKFYTLLNKSLALMKEEDYLAAVKKVDEALKLKN